MENSSAIERNIVDILNSTMVYNDYGNPKNGQPIELDISQVCDEYLKFLEMI